MDELARLLKAAAVQVENGQRHGAIKDENGNYVGGFDHNGELFTLSINTENDAFREEK